MAGTRLTHQPDRATESEQHDLLVSNGREQPIPRQCWRRQYRHWDIHNYPGQCRHCTEHSRYPESGWELDTRVGLGVEKPKAVFEYEEEGYGRVRCGEMICITSARRSGDTTYIRLEVATNATVFYSHLLRLVQQLYYSKPVAPTHNTRNPFFRLLRLVCSMVGLRPIQIAKLWVLTIVQRYGIALKHQFMKLRHGCEFSRCFDNHDV